MAVLIYFLIGILLTIGLYIKACKDFNESEYNYFDTYLADYYGCWVAFVLMLFLWPIMLLIYSIRYLIVSLKEKIEKKYITDKNKKLF